MKAGERVKHIQRAAQALGNQDQSDVMLILSEYGIYGGDPDYYEGDLESYSKQVLSGALDQTLLELVEFLEGQEAAQSLPVNPASGPWGSSPTRVFISHVHEDRELVGGVKRVLESRYGTDAFVAHDDIYPSRSWREQIKAALNSCHFFVALINQDKFHKSQWCDQEVGWALGRRVPILPVHPAEFNRDLAKDGFLEETQDLCIPDGISNPEYWLAGRIFGTIMNDPSLQAVAVKSVVEAFVVSKSYDTTRKIWAQIAKQPLIEADQLRRLEYAVQVNPEVYDANLSGKPIPELVRELVESFEPPTVSASSDEPPF